VSDQIATEVHVTRRAVLTSLVLLIAGCASPMNGALTRLQATRTTFLEPRYDIDLKMQASDWQTESAATLARVRGQVNASVGPWYNVVVPAFSDAFISALQLSGVRVDRMGSGSLSADKSLSFPLVRSFLTAGFISKTLTSSSYAPFVSVVLGLWGENGMVYQKLYVASDRSINLFITRLPPATPFLLADIESLRDNPEPTLNAFCVLAQQLGQKFAADILS